MAIEKQTDALKYYLNWSWNKGCSSLMGTPGEKSAPVDLFDAMIDGCDQRKVSHTRDLNAVTRFVFRDGSIIDMDKWCGWWRVDERIKMITGKEYSYNTETDKITECAVKFTVATDGDDAANGDERPPDVI